MKSNQYSFIVSGNDFQFWEEIWIQKYSRVARFECGNNVFMWRKNLGLSARAWTYHAKIILNS